MPGLMWCHSIHRLGWSSIFDINDSFRNLQPEVLWQPCIHKDGLGPFQNCAVASFADAVLFRRVRCCYLMNDSLSVEMFLKFLLKFPSSVTSETFDSSSCLFFDQVLINLEGAEEFYSRLAL
jgi:hypothetical protein